MGGLFSTLYHWRFYVSRWIVKKAELYDGNDSSYEIRLIDYYIDLIIFQLIETFVMVYVSYKFGLLKESIYLMIGFIPIRVTTKGIHSKTKVGCIVYSTSITLFFSYVGSFLDVYSCILIGFLLSILLIEDY